MLHVRKIDINIIKMPGINKLFYLIKKNPRYLPFLGFNFLRENIFQKLFAGFGISIFPSLVTILITQRCNYKCKGCSSASPDYTRKFKTGKCKEMVFADIKKVIDQIACFKPFIYLNGGEPTLRTDLIQIIKYVKDRHLVCALTTNGSMLTENFIKELIGSKLDFLSVSIDGPEEFHNKARGVKGAFRKATDGLERLIEFKKKEKISYPHIRLASIIYPEDLENSKYIVDLGNSLGVNEIGFGLLMYYPEKIKKMQRLFIKKYKTGGEDSIGLEIYDKQIFDFSSEKYENFLKYAKKESKIPIYFAYQGKQFNDYFNTQIFPINESRCFTPWNNLLVEPNGDLSICQGFIFGSALEGKILKQWNNPKIRRFRKLRSKTSFPACFRCNEGQKLKF